MNTETYRGLLSIRGYGESDDVLFISTLDHPLTEELKNDIVHKNVTVRYWITDKETTKSQAVENFIREISGEIDVEFTALYSEITGYLWTVENLEVGGHDLLNELTSYVGKWLIMEIDIYSS